MLPIKTLQGLIVSNKQYMISLELLLYAASNVELICTQYSNTQCAIRNHAQLPM